MGIVERRDVDLSGKVAVVTGASRGIGAAIAGAFAAHGAAVVLVSRKADGLEAVADGIRSSGGRALPVPCNTGIPGEIDALWEKVREEFGGADILVNNAATNPHFGPALEAPPWALDKTLDVNVKGYLHNCRHAAADMAARGGGSIINVASIAALSPPPGQVIYAMTKAAVVSLTRGLARELGPRGIRVNALAPGLVETDFSRVLLETDSLRDRIVGLTPLGRWGQPSEMVGAALYLASDLSSFTTGTVLVVDGGLTI